MEQQQGRARLAIAGGSLVNGQLEIRLWQSLQITMSVEGGTGLEVQPGTPLLGSDWQVSHKEPAVREALAADRIRWRQALRVEPKKPGELPLQIAPLTVRDGPQGLPVKVIWKPVPVRVVTTIQHADLSEMLDDLQPEEVPPEPRWWEPLVFPFLGLGILAAIAVAWRIWRHRVPKSVALAPDTWAIEVLARLELQSLDDPDRRRELHFALSEMVRDYLERQFRWPALEQTTAELLAQRGGEGALAGDGERILRELLEQCDLVKFAGILPSETDCKLALDLTRQFIEKTAAAPGTNPDTAAE